MDLLGVFPGGKGMVLHMVAVLVWSYFCSSHFSGNWRCCSTGYKISV
jgi:hypothetical protein